MSGCNGASGGPSSELAELIDGLAARLQAGEVVDVEAVAREHPGHAEELRRLLPALGVLEALSRSGEEGASGIAAPNAELISGVLGDFRIIREVGRGGMGVVYEAEQISLGRRVALKVLPYAAAMDPRQLQRFKNEARAAASLRHAHIVPVHAVGCERGLHFIAMDFIEGATLARLIHDAHNPESAPGEGDGAGAPPGGAVVSTLRAAGLTTEGGRHGSALYRAAARLIAQAAEALEYAHSLGVVHRDVKPGNLLVDQSGKLWVADFGLARFGTDAGLTASGDLLGTLRYMSPEQALAKHGLVDHRADVYALGATLYELLTLRPVFPGEDRQELLRQIAFEEPAPPRRLERAIPAELETVVLKALAKDPAERYAAAGELADDLRRWLAGEPVRARRVGQWERARKWVRRRPTLAALVAVTTLSVAALVVGALWSNTKLRAAAERERQQAEQASRERDAAREEQRWAAQVVDDMYTRVAEEWLGPRPRLQSLQREFLEKALEYYQHAAEQWGDDPAVRRKVPELYLRVGTIHAALGRHGPAEEALRKAIAGWEELAADAPADPSVRGPVVAAYSRLGATLLATGRASGAVEAYRRRLDLAGKLVADFPERPDFQNWLAAARGDLAFALAGAGQGSEAEATYREAVRDLEQRPALVRDHPRARFLLANIQNNRGIFYWEAARFADAESAYRQAATGFEQLVQESPANKEYREHWGFTLSNLGGALNRLDRTREARAVLVQAESVMDRLATDFPDLPDVPSELAGTQINLGVVLAKLGETGEAEKFYRKAITTLGQLAARFPTIPAHRSRLGTVQQNLGNLLRRAGHYKEAQAAGRDAVTTIEGLTRDYPKVPAHQTDLAGALFGLALTLTQAGQFAAADEAYTRALGIREKFQAGSPKNPVYRAELASTCNHLAMLLAWSQGPPYAGAGRAAELARRAVQLEPQSAGRWRTLAVAQFRVGNWQESLTAFQRAQDLSSEYFPAHFFQAMAHWNLGEQEAARRHYDAGARWLEKQANPDEKVLRLRDEAAVMLGIVGGAKGEQAPALRKKQ